MSPEEQEISLVVYCDDLATLKFRKWWESCLKHSPNSMTQTSNKAIQNKFRVMRCRSAMALGEIQYQFW